MFFVVNYKWLQKMEGAEHDTGENDVITQLYLGLLGRYPDQAGLASHANELLSGKDLSSILQRFIDSDEFLTRFPRGNTFALDGAPAMHVQTDCSAAQAAALWNHIASVWSGFGDVDPYWSVLTDEKWRMRNMADADLLNAFYDSGEVEAERFEAWLGRNHLPKPRGVCAELGCGVGRITRSLARRFDHVIAFDISQPHLDAAKARLDAEGLGNVEYRLLRAAGDLDAIPKVDCFFSLIVLQHNPPPIIIDILSRSFARLRPGGIAFFQVPTYCLGYNFSIGDYMKLIELQQSMEMHFVPQHEIFTTARAQNMFPVEVQPDWCVGHPEKWISSTFLLQKPG